MMHPKDYARRAFTLVEISIVLVIIGLMSAVILQSSQVAQPDNCYAVTQRQLADINAAITAYARAHNTYPLPAGRSLGVSNPMFGRSVTTSGDAAIDDVGGTLFGALPFQTLGLNESFAADCWGNKFSYVVTEAMTAVGSVTSGAVGGLTVKTGTATSSTDLLTSAVYGVISHGADGTGGVKKNYSGGSHGWCSYAPGDHIDRQNCNTDTVLFSTTFNNGEQSGQNFYDDLIVFGGGLNSNCDGSSYDEHWGDSNACSGAVTGPLGNGSSSTATSTTPAGTAHFVCHNGTIQLDTSVDYTCDGCTYPAGGGTKVCGGGTGCDTPHVITWRGSGGSSVSPGDPSDPGPCSATTSVMADGDFVNPFNNTATGFTGYLYIRCSGNEVEVIQGSCAVDSSPPPACASGPVYWNPGHEEMACTANLTAGAEGSAQGPVSSTNYMTGTATFKCTSGAWVEQAGSTCIVDSSHCNGTTLGWGGGACSAAFPTTPTGGSAGPYPNTTSGYTGNASASCVGGVWQTPTGPCTSSGSSCVGQDISWGGHCHAHFPPSSDGVTVSGQPNEATPAYTGAASATCTAGVWSPATGSCDAAQIPCPGTFFVSGACKYFLYPGTYDYGVGFGTLESPNTATPGYYGGSDISCTPSGAWSGGAGCNAMNGMISFSGHPAQNFGTPASQDRNCPGGILRWGNGCERAFEPVPNGLSTSSNPDDNPGNDYDSQGAASFACSNGVMTLNPGSTCTKSWTLCGTNDGCSGGLFASGVQPVYCHSAADCMSMNTSEVFNCDGSGGASHSTTIWYCKGEASHH